MTKRKTSSQTQIKKLIKEACKIRKNARAPWTGVKVGAALLTSSGKIYSGTNIESIVPDSTICAERNALFQALSKGEKKFKYIAIAAFKNRPIYPCGSCRQVLAEYCKNISIIVSDLSGKFEIKSLDELLPKAYGGRD